VSLRIATWNINSVRLRIENVRRFVEEAKPDVLCLQETKAHDDVFPAEAIRAMGFPHIAIAGMKSYNGVAIASRRPLRAAERLEWCGQSDCRHLVARIDGGLELHNFYVPAGGDIPDPLENPKFAHKLRFLDEMATFFRARKADSKRPVMLVGDLNIAPLETDVWSHKQLLGVVSHTPVEVEKMGSLQTTLGWVDAVRHFISPEEKLYSWWSYRAADWAASDRGRRLDHIWVTPALARSLAAARIARDARGWLRASDHVPVIVDLK
jgi:exodeoxyribonuclease III